MSTENDLGLLGPLNLQIHIDLNSTYGAWLVSIFITNILLGVMFFQVYHYFRNYHDRALIRGMVIILLILEVLHSVFSMHAIYHYMIINFFHPLNLLESVWSVNTLLLVKILIVILVQLSYAIRIYYVSCRRILVPALILILSIAALGLGCELIGQLFHDPLISSLFGTQVNLGGGVYIIGACINFLVVATMGYYLNKARTGIQQTEKIIDRLIMHVINHGLLTGIAEIAAIVLLFTNNPYFVGVSQVVGGLYANSWMATLNSRGTHDRIRSDSSSIIITSLSASIPSADKTSSLPGSSLDPEFDCSVTVQNWMKASEYDISLSII